LIRLQNFLLSNVASTKAELPLKNYSFHQLIEVCQISALVKFKKSFSMEGLKNLFLFNINFNIIVSFFLFINIAVKFYMSDMTDVVNILSVIAFTIVILVIYRMWQTFRDGTHNDPIIGINLKLLLSYSLDSII
jgi:magnesium-transporting ATPase (P-type)